VRSSLIAIVVLAGCGRIGFEADGTDDTDAPPADNDLLLWFPFDDSTGNRGSVQNKISCDPACPSTVPGVRDAAGGFDGATTAVRIADSPELHVTAGTIAMWIRPVALPAAGTGGASSLAGAPFGGASLNTWELYFFGEANELQLIGGGDAAGGPILRLPWTRRLGAWTHVATTWDGSTRTRMYADGIEVRTGPQFALDYDGHDVVIGVDDTPLGLMHFFEGDIDDVRFYNRELAPAEILMLATP